jgi:hypothetical protein
MNNIIFTIKQGQRLIKDNVASPILNIKEGNMMTIKLDKEPRNDLIDSL